MIEHFVNSTPRRLHPQCLRHGGHHHLRCERPQYRVHQAPKLMQLRCGRGREDPQREENNPDAYRNLLFIDSPVGVESEYAAFHRFLMNGVVQRFGAPVA